MSKFPTVAGGYLLSRRAFLLTGTASAFFTAPSATHSVGAAQLRGSAAETAPSIGLFSRAEGLSIPSDIRAVRTIGYRSKGIGAALYVADPTLGRGYAAENPLTAFADARGRVFRLSLEQDLNPYMAGASGDGDETLYPTQYVSDIPRGTTISQATRDGLAFNAIFRLLRQSGGGTLHIPAGEFRTYGYLERIDFPLRIAGAGRGLANIRNCRSSPTNTNGYGIFIVQPLTVTAVTIERVTLDGRAEERPSPGTGGEWRLLPLAVNGRPQIILDDCAFINSPVDCMRTGYRNGDMRCWLRATNCLFSNSFRNTVSLVAGWNQQYTNCIVEKGGMVHRGTNPKYCIDIEPGQAHETIKNITFSNCIVREARNSVIGGVWAGNVRFVGCRIQAFGGRPGSSKRAATPWLTVLQGGEFTFEDCDFEYLGGDYQGRLHMVNPLRRGEYARSQFVKLQDCRVSGAGIDGYGLHMELNNVVVRNSKRPVVFRGNGLQNLKIAGLRLINVFDTGNFGGYDSSFVLHRELEGIVDVRNVDVRVEPAAIPRDFNLSLKRQFGISIDPAPGNRGVTTSDLSASGYVRQLPAFLGVVPDRNLFRDWRAPLSGASGEAS